MAQIERLRQALSELEAELRDIESLEPESRAMLRRVAGDIQARLAHMDAGPSTAAATPAAASEADAGTAVAAEESEANTDSLQGTLQERVVDFEASHPQLAMILTRVIDLLGQAGI